MARILIGAGLALVAMEGLVRLVFQRPLSYQPGFGNIIQPGSTVRWGKEGHGTSHWNILGVRGASPPDLSGSAILVLGNSVVEALQVDDDEVFTALVERQLRQHQSPRAVLNTGTSGASSADYLAFARRNLNVFHPFWTVVVLRPEDLGPYAWNPSKSHFTLGEAGELRVFGRSEARPGRLRARLAPWVNRSMLLVYGVFRSLEFQAAWASEPPLFRAGFAAADSSHVPAPDTTLCPAPGGGTIDCPIEREMDLLQGAYAGRLTFLLVPSMDYHQPLVQSPIEARADAHCLRAGLSCANIRSGYPGLAARGVSPFGFSNTAFNEGHLNQDGHRLAARILLAELERVLPHGVL